VAQLVATLPHFAFLLQDAVHGAHGANIPPFIEQGGVYLPGSLVHEPFTMHEIEDLLFFHRTESPCGAPAHRDGLLAHTPPRFSAVEGGAAEIKGFTSGFRAHVDREGLHGFHQLSRLSSQGSIPSI